MKTTKNEAGSGNGKKASRVFDPVKDSGKPEAERKRPRVLHTYNVDEILAYEPPEGAELIAEGFIELGENALLYGPPGSLKGFIVGDLQVCGARGCGHWLGFEVRTRFASLWLNCENGRKRLKKQLSRMDLPPDARDYIHITGIPDILSLSTSRNGCVSQGRECVKSGPGSHQAASNEQKQTGCRARRGEEEDGFRSRRRPKALGAIPQGAALWSTHKRTIPPEKERAVVSTPRLICHSTGTRGPEKQEHRPIRELGLKEGRQNRFER